MSKFAFFILCFGLEFLGLQLSSFCNFKNDAFYFTNKIFNQEKKSIFVHIELGSNNKYYKRLGFCIALHYQ